MVSLLLNFSGYYAQMSQKKLNSNTDEGVELPAEGISQAKPVAANAQSDLQPNEESGGSPNPDSSSNKGSDVSQNSPPSPYSKPYGQISMKEAGFDTEAVIRGTCSYLGIDLISFIKIDCH